MKKPSEKPLKSIHESSETMYQFDYSYEQQDEYCYPATKVLKNKLNIMDDSELLIAEREITSLKIAHLTQQPFQGRFDFDHLQAIHRYIFSDIYVWAGEIRRGEFLAKGKTIFCLGRYINSYAADIFGKLKSENFLIGLDQEKFINRLAFQIGEVNALHPFREGNGRTTREFFRQLAKNAGFDLDFGLADQNNLLQADIEAFNRNYGPLIDILVKITSVISEI